MLSDDLHRLLEQRKREGREALLLRGLAAASSTAPLAALAHWLKPYFTGPAQVIKQVIGGPLAALSLTLIHSLRHRLVRSRQSASLVVLGFFEILKSRKMVSV